MHSPAPWKVIRGEGDESDRVYGIVDANGKDVVETDTGVYPPEVDDAVLIAAAPELLAALIYLRDNVRDDAPSMWQMVDDTIDKATKGTRQ